MSVAGDAPRGKDGVIVSSLPTSQIDTFNGPVVDIALPTHHGSLLQRMLVLTLNFSVLRAVLDTLYVIQPKHEVRQHVRGGDP